MVAAERVVDAHHHLWRLDRTPWLHGPPVARIFGEHAALRRDYAIDDFAADAVPAGVTASVHIQANVAPGEAVEEAVWAAEQGGRRGLVQAVVGFADLADPKVDAILDAMAEQAPLRGIRQQLHWHTEPAFRFAPAPDVMLRPEWQRGLREVGRRGLLFELQVFPSQYRDALTMVDAFPDTRFVLLHAGMPADASAEGRRAWRAGLAEIARRTHVWVKLSGLGTFSRSCDVAGWRPIVEQTLDAFGPARCLFGSNFPIESLWTGYDNLLAVMRACLDGLSPDERHQVLAGAATRLYGL